MVASLMLCSYAGFDVLKYFFSWFRVFWQRTIKCYFSMCVFYLCKTFMFVHHYGTQCSFCNCHCYSRLFIHLFVLAVWLTLALIIKFTLHWSRLVRGWLTICG